MSAVTGIPQQGVDDEADDLYEEVHRKGSPGWSPLVTCPVDRHRAAALLYPLGAHELLMDLLFLPKLTLGDIGSGELPHDHDSNARGNTPACSGPIFC